MAEPEPMTRERIEHYRAMLAMRTRPDGWTGVLADDLDWLLAVVAAAHALCEALDALTYFEARTPADEATIETNWRALARTLGRTEGDGG